MKKICETLPLFISKSDPSNFKDAVNFIHEIKTHFNNNPDQYDSFGKTLFEITEARISNYGDIVTLREIGDPDVERIRALLQDHRDLLAKFDTYLPPKFKSDHGETETEKVMCDDEIRSLRKFSDDDSRNAFVGEEGKTKKRKNIYEEAPVRDTNADKTRKKIRTVTQTFLREVRNRLPESSYMGVLESLFQSSTHEVKKSVKELEKKENIVGMTGELKEYLKQCQKIVAEDRMQPVKKSKLSERISVDAERGPSSPLNHPYESKDSKPSYWGNRKIDKKEEYLNNIEDDQFAQDLLIEWFKSAITHAKYLLDKDEREAKELDEEIQEKQLDKQKQHLKTFKMRFNQCLDVIDKEHMIKNLYLENPEKALPLILGYFEVKLKHLLAFKVEHDRLCKEGYKKHLISKKKKNS